MSTPTPMPEGPRGRGAWPKTGLGGTLEWDGKTPGRYYVFPDRLSGLALVGSGGWTSVSGDERAVHGAVIGIQKALNRRGKYGILVTGRFAQTTRDALVDFRTKTMGIDDGWGGLGPSTAKALFMPDLKKISRQKGIKDWTVPCGVVQNESGWDPGAVGYVKPVDIGLAQINGEAHPDMSEKQRLDPLFAFTFIVSYLTNAMKALDGNLDHAIASYNLGITGCKRWIAEGCPEIYTPPGSVPRNIPAYIDRIKSACLTDSGSA